MRCKSIERILILTIFSVSIFSLNSSSVSACSSPIIFNQFGVPVSLFGPNGQIFINGLNYPGEEIDFNISVKNTNINEEFSFTLTPSSSLFNYAQPAVVFLQPNEKKNFSIHVWINGNDRAGAMEFKGSCEQTGIQIEGFFNLLINGKQISPPNVTSCQLAQLNNGCFQGFFRNHFCQSGQIKFTETCTSVCCTKFAGAGATCKNNQCIPPSGSGTNCLDVLQNATNPVTGECKLFNNTCSIPSNWQKVSSCPSVNATEGNIAFLCNSNSCNEDNEKEKISWLRSKGWNVTSKAYNSWLFQELLKFDIIACSDEDKACKVRNIPNVLSVHKNNKKPFLEIPDFYYSHAAFGFGYVKNYAGFTGSDQLLLTKEDPITLGFNPAITILSPFNKLATMRDSNLLSGVIDLGDSGNSKGSVLFKVNENQNHGRYAFLGWFYKAAIKDLTTDGEKIVNNTLKWLKCGDACLSGTGSETNKAPVAKGGPNRTVNLGSTVSFDASQSFDPEGLPLVYFWNFGDGSIATTTSPTIDYLYSTTGTFNVTLVVNDGTFNSLPYRLTITVLKAVTNKIAFLCEDNSCGNPTEQDLIDWLESKGFSVQGKSIRSWKSSELDSFDLMVCSSTAGCNVRINSPVYNKHLKERMGFLEIPDFHFVRAGYIFKYLSWYVGFFKDQNDIKSLQNDPIVENLSQTIQVFSTNAKEAGIFSSRFNSGTKNIATLDDFLSTIFKSDISGNKGRYSYIGWFYRNDASNLTPQGEEILLRTIRWVQCGKIDSC